MDVFWYGTQTHSEWLHKSATVLECRQPLQHSVSDTGLVVVEANRGTGERTMHHGLHWLTNQRISGHRIPSLVYSFESQDNLALRFPWLRLGLPGSAFLRLPFTRTQFDAKLHELKQPLTLREREELTDPRQLLRSEYSHVHHDIKNTLMSLVPVLSSIDSCTEPDAIDKFSLCGAVLNELISLWNRQWNNGLTLEHLFLDLNGELADVCPDEANALDVDLFRSTLERFQADCSRRIRMDAQYLESSLKCCYDQLNHLSKGLEALRFG